MAVIHRISAANTDMLAKVAEDVFDKEITPARLNPFVAADGHAMFIAMDGDEVVGQIRGIVHVQPDRESDLYIDNLGVAPSHQRRGIASQLIRALIAWGEEQGCTYVWVATETDNEGGIRFYEAQSFERRTLEWFASAMGDAAAGQLTSSA